MQRFLSSLLAFQDRTFSVDEVRSRSGKARVTLTRRVLGRAPPKHFELLKLPQCRCFSTVLVLSDV